MILRISATLFFYPSGKQMFVVEERRNVLDPIATDRALAEIDAFINKRYRQRDDAKDRLEAEWAASDHRQRIERRRLLREEWADHHGRMHTLHLSLADEHASK